MRGLRETLLITAAVGSMNLLAQRSPMVSAQEIPSSPTHITATPTPHRRSGSDLGPHTLIVHDYTVRTQKFCGGEPSNPENRRFGHIELEIDTSTTAPPPILIIRDLATNPSQETQIPTSRISRGKMSASVDVDPGGYGILVDNGYGEITPLWDERKFICPTYVPTD